MKKIIFTIIASALIGNLFAQDQKKMSMTDTVFSIQEVVVSSYQPEKMEISKLEVPLKYIPISTNSISSNMLEVRGIRDIQDAARFLPGVVINTSYGSFQSATIRGFSSAPIMIDGVRDERTTVTSYPFQDLSDIQSIELLKGPASVLYGQSAVGGIINIVRKAPQAKQTANARFSYGSWNDRQATLGLGGKIYGPVNYRANINYVTQDGWRDTGNERLSSYLALSSQLGTKSTIEVRGGLNRDFYGTEIGLPANMSYDTYNTSDDKLYLKQGEMQPGLNKTARYNNESDFFHNNGWNLSTQYVYKFSDKLKLMDKLSYNDDDINYFGTEALSYLTSNNPIYKNYYLTTSGAKKYICIDTVQLNSPLRFSHMAKTINNQLEFSGKLDMGPIVNNFLFGYSFTRLNRNTYTGYTLGEDVTGPGLYSKVPVHDPNSMGYMDTRFSKVGITRRDMHGIYLQDVLEFNEHWKMMLSGRYDYYSYKRSDAPTVEGERKYNEADMTPYKKSPSSAFSYRAGLVYLPHQNWSLYGSVGSFFAPYTDFYSENIIYIDSNGNEYFPKEGDEIFKPQTGYQTEIGIRYTFSKIVEADASVFYIRRENMKQTLGTTDVEKDEKTVTKSIVGQVGCSDSKGFDVDVTLTLVRDMALTIGYSFTDAKVQDLKKNPYMDDNPSKGQRYAGVPENQFYAYGSYLISKGVLKNLGFNLSCTYRDKVYRNVTSGTYYPAYWLTDIGASFSINQIMFSVMINNVFDENYCNASLGNQMVPSKPVNYQMAITYKF